MNIESFARVVKELGIDQSAFAIGEECDERYCILEEEAEWLVFYSERGLRSGLRRFGTESQAIEDLLTRLREDPLTRTL